MSLDDFYNKQYHRSDYNCSHFVRDVWLFLKGVDISDLVGAFNSGELITAMKARSDLTALEKPLDPSIAWFQTDPKEPPHVGIYIEGQIFHMTPDGPKLHPLLWVSSQYKKVKFYDA